VLFAIAWARALAALGDWLGFSKEVGAFLAGVSLASTPYPRGDRRRLVSLRDFLLLFFFIDLGAGSTSRCSARSSAGGVLSLFVLIGNPLIVMAIMGYMGYRKRTGFLAGLTVAQISEFSLIFGALGISARPHRRGGDGADHAGRARHHRAVDLHDPLLAGRSTSGWRRGSASSSTLSCRAALESPFSPRGATIA
jgi:Kef-type K+ transport system membrane component KefB